MSKSRPDLSNKPTDIKKYIGWLSELKSVTAIYVAGSRSPLREKEATEDSDWDLTVVFRGIDKLVLPNPREQFKIHVDTLCLPESKMVHYPKHAMVYPEDPHNIFK